MINLENLKPVNNVPIDVDYNNMDDEGGIRLDNRGAVQSIDDLKITLKEGQLVWISDTELDYLGVIVKRRDCWVVVTIDGTRNDLN